ncbi:MAG: molecular chaperone HtpG [Coriobacteriales bacterium]|jgi:molecular chaperone HtpG|nr:molecular chaperone HtpG [Coriobacteriales bacterium]
MKKFKTESQRLLDLVINSIYTNREIFLRELISNASDAIDKLSFRSLTDTSISLNRDSLAIRITPDKATRTITISDNGIGMTREDLEKNLGTIAHSGSLDFLEQNAIDANGAATDAADATTNATNGAATDAADATDAASGGAGSSPKGAARSDISIIGQFGVGFYSAFMVASAVRVVSRAQGCDEAFAWESDGREGYSVRKAQRAQAGTDVILTLKEDGAEENYSAFLEPYTIQELVKKYSNYVRYPIQMELERHRAKPKPDDAPDDYQIEYEDVLELETLNSMTPIWKRGKGEVSDEEYEEFYRAEFHDYNAPARRVSLHVEGALTYDALLFVPAHAPYDFYSRDYRGGLALYTNNVLIMERCEELLPDYFGFVRGVVDSPDLTLNISRETLQHNHQLRAISKRVAKRIKQELLDFCANDRDSYEAFFHDFGQSLKFGIYSSYGQNREVLADLLLYYSAKQERMVTLDEYLTDVREDQEHILYAVGDSLERLKKLPVVTSALARGYDVLLGDAEVDEFALMMLGEYSRAADADASGSAADAAAEGSDSASDVGRNDTSVPRSYTLKNIMSEGLDLGTEEEKAAAEQVEKDNEPLFEAMARALDGAVGKVIVSTRLADAPVCISSSGPISLEMEKTFARMPGGEEKPKAERVLEINAAHPVFAKLKAAFAEERSEELARYTKVLYGQALLIEGLPLDDPIAYAQEICELL